LGRSDQRLWKAPYIDFLPNYSLYYPWVLATAALVEYNIILLLITGATIFYGGRYLERAWSSAEFGKFVLVVAVVSNSLTALCWWLIYVGGDGFIEYAHLYIESVSDLTLLTVVLQFSIDSWRSGLASWLLSCLQAACTGTYSGDCQGHYQDSRQGRPISSKIRDVGC
jgi:hypothetical protein